MSERASERAEEAPAVQRRSNRWLADVKPRRAPPRPAWRDGEERWMGRGQ